MRYVRMDIAALVPDFVGTDISDAIEWLAQWERDNPDPVPLATRIANNDPAYTEILEGENEGDDMPVKKFKTFLFDDQTEEWEIWR